MTLLFKANPNLPRDMLNIVRYRLISKLPRDPRIQQLAP